MSRLDEMNKNFYREFFAPKDLVFDIGANVGEWTEACLKNGAGRVVAIEPQKELVDILVSKFRNDPVDVLDVAIGDEVKIAPMMQCEANRLASLNPLWTHGRFKDYGWRKGEAVKVVTLDMVIERYGIPRFTKIDVEGYEDKVLSSLSCPLHSFCLEYTCELFEIAWRCMDMLDNLGEYEYSYNLGDYPVFAHKWDTRKSIVRQLESIEDHNLWGSLYARLKG